MSLTALFVDDSALQLSLYKKLTNHLGSSQWEFFFADDALDALELLHFVTVDLVITDLEMPFINGVHFLDMVAEKEPAALRCILSAACSKEDSLSTVRITHQYFHKPLDIRVLEHILAVVVRLRELPLDQHARRWVHVLPSLPIPSQTFNELVTHLSDRHNSVKSVAAIIARDPAATASILKLVNTPFFGCTGTIFSPLQAVALLGIDIVRSLYLLSYLRKIKPSSCGEPPYSFSALAERSFMAYGIAKRLCIHKRIPLEERERVCLAALVMDIGIIVINALYPREVRQYLTTATVPFSTGEERGIVGVSHQDLSQYLLGIWGFEISLIELVEKHHCHGTACMNEGRRILYMTTVHLDCILYDMEPQEYLPASCDKDLAEEICLLYSYSTDML